MIENVEKFENHNKNNPKDTHRSSVYRVHSHVSSCMWQYLSAGW